jgi:DNA-binding beta-propeller fold protein YncE
MLALIYLALAIYLGDLVCRRFYPFVSIPHRWAAAILVGILLSTWFTYLVGLAFAHTADALLWADLLFFVVASGAIFWLSRKTPKADMIAPRARDSAGWDWITLGALFAAVCVLLMGTFYVNKKGRIGLSGIEVSDFASKLAITQSFALGHNFPTEYLHYASQPYHYYFLFYFQAGNLALLGLNLAWSIDVLSVLSLVSLLALIMTLGELLFNSRVVGRLGAALFFLNGSPLHLINFLSFGRPHPGETPGFWTQVVFVRQRHLPFAIGIFLLVLIFLLDRYRQRTSAAESSSDAKIALSDSKAAGNWTQRKAAFVFSALLLVALPVWNAQVFIAVAVVLLFLVAAYGLWWLRKVKSLPILGPVVAITLTACILAAGVIDLLAVYNSPSVELTYEREPLVKGLVFRTSAIYKIPEALPAGLAGKDSSKLPVTAFEGGHGRGKCQFENPRGLAVDSGGNIFVADTDNGRIQKFSPNGTFVTSIATTDPNGIAVDHAGNIYVAEIGSKHCVQKLAPDGKFIAKWAPGLYGPRKIAIGPDDSIYVVDSGNNRIVKLSPDGQVLASWGSDGNGDGQFKGLSSVAVDSTNRKVYVADPLNSRIQVFDSEGKFLTKWSISEWGQPLGFEDLAIDLDRGRLYASSTHMNTILVLDFQGNRTGTLTPNPPDKLDGPSALALAKGKLLVLNSGSARVSLIDLQNR